MCAIWRLEDIPVQASQFAAILPIVMGGLVKKITEETHVSADIAFDRLYNSKLYAELENDATKVWTYSAAKLFDIYQIEMSSGELELPEY